MSFLSNLTIQEALPGGVIFPFAGSAAPTGWLLCNGAAISRTVYSRLFAAIGTTYGVGDGSTTFNLPNSQGVFLRGAGTQIISGRTYTATIGTSAIDSTRRPNSALVTDSQGNHQHAVLAEGRWNLDGEAFPGFTRTSTNAYNMTIGASNSTTNNSTDTQGAHGHSITGGGDPETRPGNVTVNYIIKT
jgi:microcystin-dependent protein